MPSSKILHRLATRPHEYARYLQTGRLPRGVRPDSPLIRLLKALSPRDLVQIAGVTVNSSLGYTGSRQFANALQALQWVAPADEVFDSFPAESWRDKRFAKQLHLEDLGAVSARFPEHLYARYPRLCASSHAPVGSGGPGSPVGPESGA